MTTNEKKLKSAMSAQARLDQAVFNITKSDPWVPIMFRVDGEDKQFKLEFSYGAVLDFFQETGLTLGVDDVTTAQFENPTMLFTALKHGLSTHQPDLDAASLRKIIRMQHRVYYVLCIQKAMTATQPDMTDVLADLEGMEAQEGKLPLQETPTSLTSGLNVVT